MIRSAGAEQFLERGVQEVASDEDGVGCFVVLELRRHLGNVCRSHRFDWVAEPVVASHPAKILHRTPSITGLAVTNSP